jgi:hypothetical protein
MARIKVHESDAEASDTSVPEKYLASNEDTPVSGDGAGKIETVSPKQDKPHKMGRWFTRRWGKAVLITAGIILIVVAVFAIPVSRYALAGLVIKKDVSFTVTDPATNKPISEADVTLLGQHAKSDAKGMARLRSIPVGQYSVSISKKYYKSTAQALTVPILSAPQTLAVSLVATGRQVPVKVVNKIGGKPIEKAIVAAADTTAQTDANGEAVIVLPADKQTLDGTVKLDGYNNTSIKIQITEQKDDKNTFTLVPAGKIYFLSKRTGTINVMQSDLDGGNAKTIIQGTGKEDEYGTVLLASRDWKYLALQAKRDSDQPKLYLIDTANPKLTTIDEGDAAFSPVGWYNHYFVYTLTRTKLQQWQDKRSATKSFNAESGKLSTLDETKATGTGDYDAVYENLESTNIVEGKVIVAKDWSSYDWYRLPGQKITISSVKLDGSGKQILKDFDAATGIGPAANRNYISRGNVYKPQEIEFLVRVNGSSTFWEYDHGTVSEAKDMNVDEFYKGYNTYLLSPSGQKTVWFESRDGRNILLLGDGNGDNAKEIGNFEDFTPYGWYGESYVLLSKKGSELYVAPVKDALTDKDLVKVTDYHKPRTGFYGYSYGYGGL